MCILYDFSAKKIVSCFYSMMLVASLLILSARCVAKHSKYCNLVGLLSWDLPVEIRQAVWKFLPIDRVIDLEENNNQDMFLEFWSILVERCKLINYAFKRRLELHLHPFISCHLHCTKVCILTSQAGRQVLLNSLFQEAVDMAHRLHSGKTFGLPAFALHAALQDNCPSVSHSTWLLILSKRISNFHFNARHGVMLCKHKELSQNIAKSCHHLDLVLNVTLDSNYSLLCHYYLVVYRMLSLLRTPCVVVSLGNVGSAGVSLLELCSGKVDRSIILSCNHGSKFYKEQPSFSVVDSDVDIWDNALGEHFSDTSQDLSDEDIYEDLQIVQAPQPTCYYTSTQVNICNHYMAISQLVIDLSIINESSIEFCAILNDWVSLKDLKISLPSRASFMTVNVDSYLIASVASLLMKPNARLIKLFLCNFLFSASVVLQLIKGLLASNQRRNLCLCDLTFFECYFDLPCCRNTLDWNTLESKRVLECLTLHCCKFSNTDSVTNFSKCFFSGCFPSQFSLYGNCTWFNEKNCSNYKLLFEYLHNIHLPKNEVLNIKKIASINFNIPDSSTNADTFSFQQWHSVLSTCQIDSFTFYVSASQSVPLELYEPVKQSSVSCKTVHYTPFSDVSTSFTFHDYLSEM